MYTKHIYKLIDKHPNLTPGQYYWMVGMLYQYPLCCIRSFAESPYINYFEYMMTEHEHPEELVEEWVLCPKCIQVYKQKGWI